MRVAVILCIVILITAWYAPVLADEPAPDYDALILAGLENQTVTDEIERVLQDEDALLAFEPACCLAEEQMAGVSHSTYERIRQTYATDERVNNLMEQHVKRDSVVDLTFKGMPFESETWLVRLIVVIVVVVVIAVLAYYVAPYLPAWSATRDAIASARAAIRVAERAEQISTAVHPCDVWDAVESAQTAIHCLSPSGRGSLPQAWAVLETAWRYVHTVARASGNAELVAEAVAGWQDAVAHTQMLPY